MIATTTLDTPVGQLTLAASSHGLRLVLWPGELRTIDAGADDGAGGLDPTEVLDQAVRELTEYFAGDRQQFDLPLDPVGTPFQQSVWQVLRTIPYAGTMSYGEQARALGDPNKARAVGAANGRNPISIIVPCHRVVGKNGSLTGFAGGIDAKAWLLDHERRVLATR
ncbi:MAG: methylated-DNA--[protein]-cysteine S-methyltransferase [Acidimicrobiales bacterium]